MIDDYAKAQALVEKMKAVLPIPVRATADLARATNWTLNKPIVQM